MRTFLTGGTGAVGRPALAALLDAGHDVTAVVRSPEKRAQVEAAGARGVAVDLFDAAAVAAAVDGHEAVVNLATHVPTLRAASRVSAWSEHDRLRREASGHLVDAALAAGAGRFVQESIVFLYPDGGDRWLDAAANEPEPWALTAAPPGVYDVVDDEPVTRRAYAAALAAAAGRRRAVRVPGRLGRFAGPQGRATARSQRVSNRRFREVTGWSPRWRSVAEGFATLTN